MSTNVLMDRDVNTNTSKNPCKPDSECRPDNMSMEYHRQVLQSKANENQDKVTYVSPSDTIMSPCTAKLSAYRNKQVGKAKPKSLFAKTSAKSLESNGSLFGLQTATENLSRHIETSKPTGV